MNRILVGRWLGLAVAVAAGCVPAMAAPNGPGLSSALRERLALRPGPALAQPVSVAPMATSVLPQFAFGDGWYSAIYFTNYSSQAVSFAVNFYRDDGTPLIVPSIGAAVKQVNLAAKGSTVIEAPNTGSLVQGYVAFSLPAGVRGYGVFRQNVPNLPDQEAVVPLSDTTSTTSTLTWDETKFVTGVAIVNPSSVDATVTVTAWDETGKLIGTSSIPLPAGQKAVNTLRSFAGLTGIAGHRGSARFTTTTGAVAVLGLRFLGTSFTSIPTTGGAATASQMKILPQFVFGDVWYSALYFTNLTDAAISFPVTFSDDNGAPLTVPGIGGSTAQVTLPAHGTTMLEAPNGGSLMQGTAKVDLPAGVYGYGVFRQSVDGRPDQEAVVPFSDPAQMANRLTWDDSNLTTAVAVVNPSSLANTVTVTVWDENGNLIGTTTLPLAAGTKTASTLRSLPGLAGMAGHRGSAEFSVSSGAVAVLGLRFNGTAFTSIPTSTVQNDTLVSEKALTQTGLAIALASTVLQSQLQILEKQTNEDTTCTALDGGGSTQGGNVAMVFYDSNCTKPYIAAIPQIVMPNDNEANITESATYYGLDGKAVGSMSLKETARFDGVDTVNVYGLGVFTPNTGSKTPVQLGLYCAIGSNLVGSCAGGIAQDFPALGLAIGAVTPLTLQLGGTSFASPVTFAGGGSAVTGTVGSLTLTNPAPTSLVIQGGSAFATTRASGGAAGFELFPPTPTAWSIADTGHDQEFQITVVDNTTRNLTVKLIQISSGAVLATGNLDQSGAGQITWSDGSTTTVTNWTLGD